MVSPPIVVIGVLLNMSFPPSLLLNDLLGGLNKALGAFENDLLPMF